MLLTKFINNVREQHLFPTDGRLLLAVSGGVDSVVLCELCCQAGYSFEIAHANFGLRGQESEDDEQLVRSLAAKYNAALHVRKFDTTTYMEERNMSVQVAARSLRYEWFEELLGPQGGRLLTAHHAGDNIETVMMHFFRGTGISGLRGIPAVSGRTVRPLLPFFKEEIIRFATEQGLTWREDSSNATEKYSRNYFRNAVIPLVSKIFPEAEQNLLNNIARFSQVEELYMQAIEAHKKKLIQEKGTERHIPVLKLMKTTPLESVVFEIISEFNFSAHQVAEVIHLLRSEQGKFIQSPTHRIFKNRKWLIIAPTQSTAASNILVRESDHSVEFSAFTMHLKRMASEKLSLPSPAHVAVLNAKKLEFPLLLRKWKAGDYFYPLGLGKKKKVSRLLIDKKFSPTEKENVWVLESGKKICWVVGLRIDDRFKISDSTKEVIEIEVKSEK